MKVSYKFYFFVFLLVMALIFKDKGKNHVDDIIRTSPYVLEHFGEIVRYKVRRKSKSFNGNFVNPERVKKYKYYFFIYIEGRKRSGYVEVILRMKDDDLEDFEIALINDD